VVEDVQKISLNRLVDHHSGKRGILTMGLPFLSLQDVLEKAHKKPDVLKLGVVHPLPQKRIRDFIAGYEEVKRLLIHHVYPVILSKIK